MGSYSKTFLILFRKPDTIRSVKRLRKKLQKCRDPDRADLVALQRARREQASTKPKAASNGGLLADAAVFGDIDRETKRIKLDDAPALNSQAGEGKASGSNMFGPPL